jgi:FMN hydrolase / 5-amino-6-(5-phospho-D-ribitylamino)uracil phosphatase
MRTDPRRPLITVDLDETVWPCRPVIRAAEVAMYTWLEREAPRLTAVHDQESLRAHRRGIMERRPEIAHDMTLIRRDSLRELLAGLDYPPNLADAAVALFREHRNRVEPFADVQPALLRLRERFRLVSVTNGNADVFRTPLGACFDHAITAADVGAAKPDPAMFQAALEWAEVGPEQALHVGDDARLDCAAAQDLGIGAIWVNRGGHEWPEELAPPRLTVADLTGLLDWLDTGAPGWPGSADAGP